MKQSIIKLIFTSALVLTLLGCSTSVIEKVEPPQADVTYVADIKSIIDAHCTSCHGATNPVAGLNLTTYALVKAKTQTGAIINRVSSTSSPMPPAPNPRLSDANIALIQKWIDDGYKEN